MKKKYIYLIGILVVICLVIFVVFYNKGNIVKVYDKYSARIGIMYDGDSYSRSFDYDGSVGRVIYDDGTVYMDSKGMYYALDDKELEEFNRTHSGDKTICYLKG